MPHADASVFPSGASKEETYAQVLEQAQGLVICRFLGEICSAYLTTSAPLSNLANAASLLWHAYKSLPAPSNAVNWCGFYTLAPPPSVLTPATSSRANGKADILILGPFCGRPACQWIAFRRGVCGTAAAEGATQLVGDVHKWPGHIACDAESKSEIVVPIKIKDASGAGEKVIAVLDVDCALENGFDDVDKVHLEKFAVLLATACDW